jgi:predicted esterase
MEDVAFQRTRSARRSKQEAVAARQQKIRVHFLVALTLAILALGVTRFFRSYHRQQVRTQYARTEVELRKYATDLIQAEHKQLESLAMVEPGRIGRDAAALLMQARYQTDQSTAKGAAATAGSVAQALAAIRTNFDRLRAGEPAVFPQGVPFLRAYYSGIDGTFQPYTICVPKGYTGDRPLPLILTLHGLAGFTPFQCLSAPYYQGAISVAPEGRGATDYMYTGEDDVLAVVKEVCDLYSVDRDRVYIVGHSMGATGCWNLAARNPHLFTGIVPISGNADHHAWEQRWGWNPQASAAHQGLRTFLLSSFSPASYAENLQYCHIVALHGTGDNVVPVEHARGMVERLRELGYALEYLEFPQAAHGGMPAWTQEYAMAKVMGQPPRETPARFVYKTADLRHDGAWWLRLDRLGDPVRFSMVRAEAKDGLAEITTDNVTALTVLLDQVPGRVDLVRVDGAEFPVAAKPAVPGYRLEKWAGAWRAASATGILKRKALSGPFSDVFLDPFIVIYGTSGDSELHKNISRGEAARFAADWQLRYGEGPRVKADSEVTDDDIAKFNLLIFGGADVNSVAAKMMPGMAVPVAVSDGVSIGTRVYKGHGAGVMVCCPNPLNPERMVALVAGTTPAALYQAYSRTGLWFNWGVYDEYKWFDYAVFDNRTAGPDTFLAAGFFDNQWQLPTDGAAPAGGGATWKGDPEAIAAVIPQAFPMLTSAADSKDLQVSLSEVRPTVIDQYRGAVGFDRSYTGEAVRLGDQTFAKALGIRPPSSISFALEGRFGRFTATVGLTRGAKEEISAARKAAEGVVFEVWGDGLLLRDSPTLGWQEGTQNWSQISADVHGVGTLTLKARPTSGATWLYGSCAWGEPTVSR